MPSLKEFNKKIGSLKNTRKITKTMKMVAASKFRKVYKAQVSARIYSDKLTEMMSRLSSSADQDAHPLLRRRVPVKNILVLVMTSDRGLCGGFNNNLIRFLRQWVETNRGKFQNIEFSFCGKKGMTALQKAVRMNQYYEGITARPQFTNALKVVEDLTKAFISGQYDEVYVSYNIFKSAIAQRPAVEKILPIDPTLMKTTEKKETSNYIFEPQEEILLGLLIPRYVSYRIYEALLENAAGEHGARMTAMDNASRNTNDLIDKYTLLRNRARQASITKELIEIISGAEALN